MEITIFIVIVLVAFLCVFFHWQSLTKFAQSRAAAFYSHYQNLSNELNKFPLDPTTDYVQVVVNTIDEVIETHQLSVETIHDSHDYAVEVITHATRVATRSGRLMAFRDVVLAAVLFDLEAKNNKIPSRYVAYHASLTVGAIIPPHF